MLKDNNDKVSYMLYVLETAMNKVCENVDKDAISKIGKSPENHDDFTSVVNTENILETLLIKKLREVYRSK